MSPMVRRTRYKPTAPGAPEAPEDRAQPTPEPAVGVGGLGGVRWGGGDADRSLCQPPSPRHGTHVLWMYKVPRYAPERQTDIQTAPSMPVFQIQNCTVRTNYTTRKTHTRRTMHRVAHHRSLEPRHSHYKGTVLTNRQLSLHHSLSWYKLWACACACASAGERG
jgi:hypothetical protein